MSSTSALGGTVGWVMASWPFVFILGAHSGPLEVRSIFIVSGVISLALAAFSLTLPHTPPKKGGEGDDIDALAWRRALGLLKKPFVAVLFFGTFIDSVVHNGYFVMADAFLTNRVGIAGNLSMVVLSLGQIAEVLTMLVLGTGLGRLIVVQLFSFEFLPGCTYVLGVLGGGLLLVLAFALGGSLPLLRTRPAEALREL